MTKQEILTWLEANRQYLKVSAIGRDAGARKLLDILNQNKDGAGYPATLADHHLPELTRIINKIRK